MNMEEHNYWNDPRVRAGMINKGKLVQEGASNYIVVESDDGDIKLLCKWGVCPTCKGNGVHVNPSIDASGLTTAEFDEDPGFLAEYMEGRFDVQCAECDGRRVIPVVDEHNNKEMLARYDKHLKEEYQYAAIVAAERARGA